MSRQAKPSASNVAKASTTSGKPTPTAWKDRLLSEDYD